MTNLLKDVSLLELTTISVAILALLLPSFRNWYNEWKRLRGTKRYILHILNGVLPPITTKIEGLEKLVQSVRNTESKTYSFIQYTTYYFETYNKIGHNDLYKIFVTNNIRLNRKSKIKYFSNLNRSIGFFLKHNEIERYNMTKFIEDRRRYEKSYKMNLNTILRKSDNYKSINIKEKILEKNDPFLVEFLNIVLKWHNDKDKNLLNVTQSLLINPLNSICKNNPSDDRAMEILPLTINCEYEYSDMINLHSIHSNSLDDSLKKIKKFKKYIEDFIQFYF